MKKIKILLLSHIEDFGSKTLYNTNDHLIQTLLDNNVLYLNYIEIYNKYGFSGAHNYIKEYVKNNEINSIIFGSNPSEFHFDINLLEKLRKEIFLVMLTGDTELNYEVRDQYYAQAMDFVIVQDFITTLKLRQIGINSMSYYGYYDATKYRKIETFPKDIDISFTGVLRGRAGRLDYIKYLSDNGVRVETFGEDSSNGQITFEKKIEIINRSKITLDFNGASEGNKSNIYHQINKRKKQFKGKRLESALCGSFALCEYVPGEHFFEIGKEIDVFYDKEELLGKVKYYLKHEEERESIARRGYERAKRDYDAKLAVPKLLSTIDELRKKKIYKPSEIYLDEVFIRNYTTFRVFLIIRFIKAGKWKFAIEELKIVLKYRKLDWYQSCIFIIKGITDKFPTIRSFLKNIYKDNSRLWIK